MREPFKPNVSERMVSENEIPEGWSRATLQDLASRIQYGYTASAIHQLNGPRFLRITDIQNGNVNWESVPTCKIKRSDLEKFALRPGDIVFARTGATTGKSFLIVSCPNDAVFASYLIRVSPNGGVNSEFLSLFFQTVEYWQFISENVAGNAQPNCNATKLAALLVPFPPAAEQARINAKVGPLLARVRATQERLARVPAILKRFRQAVLAAACSGRLTADWRKQHNEVEPAKVLLQKIEQFRSQGIKKTPSGRVPDDPESKTRLLYETCQNLGRGAERMRFRPFVSAGHHREKCRPIGTVILLGSVQAR